MKGVELVRTGIEYIDEERSGNDEENIGMNEEEIQ